MAYYLSSNCIPKWSAL